MQFDLGVSPSPTALVRHVKGELVLLDLAGEQYFGLDAVGTAMWEALARHQTIESAYRALLDEFDADPEELRADLSELVDKLAASGLVELNDGTH